MIKSLKNLWALFLFQDKGILPSRKLLISYITFSIVLFVLSFTSISWAFLIAANILFLLLSFIDFLFVPRRKFIQVIRGVTHEMERGRSSQVTVTFENKSKYDCSFEVLDDIPQVFKSSLPISGNTAAGSTSQETYQVKPEVRGKYELNQLSVRYSSRFGLWKKQHAIKQTDLIKVIPDLTDTRHFLENAQQFLLYEGNKIRRQQRGAGEFSRVRNYVVGDDPRMINWRQTAKLQEVMTNEYEPEHGKNLTILIDCGRMMGAELNKGNRLEKTLEASITVAAAALKNGDYVGVLAFSSDIKVYVAPEKGMDQLQKILQSIYHLQVDSVESNYAGVMNYLQTMQKKRSLILLFSDIQSFLQEESTLHYLKRLRQKHLFLMIGIVDQALEASAKQDPETVRNAMVKSIAQQQIQTKKQAKSQWEAKGLVMVEAEEEHLATESVSEVIHWMNQGLL